MLPSSTARTTGARSAGPLAPCSCNPSCAAGACPQAAARPQAREHRGDEGGRVVDEAQGLLSLGHALFERLLAAARRELERGGGKLRITATLRCHWAWVSGYVSWVQPL